MEKNNLEKICRTRAFVEMRDVPYDEGLSQLQKDIQNKYDEAKSSYDANINNAKKIMGELEEVSSGLRVIFPTFKSILNGNGELDKILSLGSSLVSNKDKLKLLQKTVNDSYNKNAALVYELAFGMKKVEGSVAQYGKDLEQTGKNMEILHGLHKDPKELREHVIEIINKKQDKISKNKKNEIINCLISKGEEEIENLSKRYLELKNDLPIARSLLSYKPLIEKYNELTDSFGVIRERLNNDITKIDEILLIYEVITKSEIDYLKNINLPDKYIEAINNLVYEMEKVEDKFADRILENYYSNEKSSRVSDFSVSEVVHDLIKHVKKREDEKNE